MIHSKETMREICNVSNENDNDGADIDHARVS